MLFWGEEDRAAVALKSGEVLEQNLLGKEAGTRAKYAHAIRYWPKNDKRIFMHQFESLSCQLVKAGLIAEPRRATVRIYIGEQSPLPCHPLLPTELKTRVENT